MIGGECAVPMSLEYFLSLTSLTVIAFIPPTTLGSLSSLFLIGVALSLPYIIVMPFAFGPHLGDIELFD